MISTDNISTITDNNLFFTDFILLITDNNLFFTDFILLITDNILAITEKNKIVIRKREIWGRLTRFYFGVFEKKSQKKYVIKKKVLILHTHKKGNKNKS